MFKVRVSVSYGGLSLGDEAFLQALIAELRQAAEAEIYLREVALAHELGGG